MAKKRGGWTRTVNYLHNYSAEQDAWLKKDCVVPCKKASGKEVIAGTFYRKFGLTNPKKRPSVNAIYYRAMMLQGKWQKPSGKNVSPDVPKDGQKKPADFVVLVDEVEVWSGSQLPSISRQSAVVIDGDVCHLGDGKVTVKSMVVREVPFG